VAYRGNIALEDITVDFEVEPVDLPNAIGFGVRELVTLKGRISESERVRLERASRFCPVGQALTKGSMKIEDEVRWESGEVAEIPAGLESLPQLDDALPDTPSGSVHGQYLLDTKEYDHSGIMEREGEAKISVRCENLTRTSRWILLGGHSSDGWVPPPFPLAQGGWAASTASTLSCLLPRVGDSNSLKVELHMAPGRNRGASQSNAAEGIVAHRKVLRRIAVPGSPSTLPIEIIQAALQRDPISLAYRNGGILLRDEVVVESY